MGGHISYKGKTVAHYNFCLRGKEPADTENVYKVNIRFYSLEDMESLLRAKSDEVISFDDDEMSYSQFREDYLKNSNRIYASKEAEIMDSAHEFVKGLNKKGSLRRYLRDKKAHEELEKILNKSSFLNKEIEIQVKSI